ncbi:MAG: hypothetical protein ABI977_33860 [Acidobacteriota bacterium]
MKHTIFAANSLVLYLAIVVSAFPQETQDIPVKILSTYKKGNQTWTNLLIPKKISQEKLVKMAKELHRAAPSTYFRFFDDDKEFPQFKNWDMNYPNPVYPYPQKWVKEHHIANIQKMAYDANGPKWVFIKGYTTEKIADLE